MTSSADLDVLIVGAGPTGLSLAVQLARAGLRFRIVDALADRRLESRALAVHARTLELLDTIDAAWPLVALGRRALRVRLHLGRSDVTVSLGDIDAPGTRFPFVLFVSQADTEAAICTWLEAHGVAVERGRTARIDPSTDGDVACRLLGRDGGEERFLARYVVGCDGAHSTVRHVAGIAFDGDAYPHRFMLADVEIEGDIEPDTLHSYPGVRGALMVFPLGRPRSWRVIAIDPTDAAEIAPSGQADLALETLQSFVDRVTGHRLRLHDPAWITRFRLHHRQAATYRRGRLFLAGDAAHIHSPAGGQGMNTGIQDAWNLGWKLGLVCRGEAPESLLDTYHAERWPVGRFLLRYTDRLFTIATRLVAAGPATAHARNVAVRWLLPIVMASSRLRARGFRTLSQLGIRYRDSPAVCEGRPAIVDGPRAGDRLPDVETVEDGVPTTLQSVVREPAFHWLWCAPVVVPADLVRWAGAHGITPHHLDSGLAENASAMRRLGVASRGSAQYLVRPDGHIAFRCAGTDVGELRRYIATWFSSH
ncbi:MAG: FAD-dependent monooxygenase [Vicinamibacterales bacterium]